MGTVDSVLAGAGRDAESAITAASTTTTATSAAATPSRRPVRLLGAGGRTASVVGSGNGAANTLVAGRRPTGGCN
ncbi:hypothetical protein AAV95_19355, partial [Mycolicibacterium elephantis]